MPKPQLTREAIAFIIQVRDDPTTINTWQDISNMVKNKFGIEVSLQGIAKSYHRHKNDTQIKQCINKANDTIAEIKQKVEPKKPAFKVKPQPNTSISKPVFSKDEKIDLKDLFSEADTE